MGHDYHRLAALAIEALDRLQHPFGRARIQFARRFVRQQDRRVVDQRPRDRNPLLLPARELHGPVAHPAAQADLLQQRCASCRAEAASRPAYRAASSTFSRAFRLAIN